MENTSQIVTSYQTVISGTQEVIDMLMTHEGDEVAIKKLAYRITDGLSDDLYDAAATHSFVSLIDLLCAEGKIVAVI